MRLPAFLHGRGRGDVRSAVPGGTRRDFFGDAGDQLRPSDLALPAVVPDPAHVPAPAATHGHPARHAA